MKPIQTMCDRFFEGKPNLVKKWRMTFYHHKDKINQWRKEHYPHMKERWVALFEQPTTSR